ncbi:hypothetical protein D9M70_495320 [compost metagenome]
MRQVLGQAEPLPIEPTHRCHGVGIALIGRLLVPPGSLGIVLRDAAVTLTIEPAERRLAVGVAASRRLLEHALALVYVHRTIGPID